MQSLPTQTILSCPGNLAQPGKGMDGGGSCLRSTDCTHLCVKPGALCTKSDAKKTFPIAAVFSGRGNKGKKSPWCCGEVRNTVHPTTDSIADSQLGTCCFVNPQVYWFQVRRKAIFHLSDNNQSPKRVTEFGWPQFLLVAEFPEKLQQNQTVREFMCESTAVFSQGSSSHRNHKISFPAAACALPAGLQLSMCSLGSPQLSVVEGDRFLQQRMMGSKQY